MLSLPFSPQGWTKKAERIKCPAPLPEDPTIPLLMRMLVPVRYQAPETYQALEKKTRRRAMRPKVASAIKVLRTLRLEIPKLPPPTREMNRRKRAILPLRGEKKRAASMDIEVEASKKGKISLSDD